VEEKLAGHSRRTPVAWGGSDVDCWCEVSRRIADRGAIRSLRFIDPARSATPYLGQPIASLLADLGARGSVHRVAGFLDGSRDVGTVELLATQRAFLEIMPRALDEATLLLTVRRFDAQLLRKLIEARIAGHERQSRLSLREREVLRILLRGHSVDDAAGRLRIAPRTVKYHLGNILSKLGAESRFDLFRVLLP
jgi:DNA-binding CsgD family transcriptional regulator